MVLLALVVVLLAWSSSSGVLHGSCRRRCLKSRVGRALQLAMGELGHRADRCTTQRHIWGMSPDSPAMMSGCVAPFLHQLMAGVRLGGCSRRGPGSVSVEAVRGQPMLGHGGLRSSRNLLESGDRLTVLLLL